MTKLFNPNEGLFGRKGGPFLDDVQRKQAEETRAIREGREPNFENMQPHVGDVLRTEEQILQEQINGVHPPTLDELKDFKGVTAKPVVETSDDEVSEPESEPELDENGEPVKPEFNL